MEGQGGPEMTTEETQNETNLHLIESIQSFSRVLKENFAIL